MQQVYALVNRDLGCSRGFDNSSHLKQFIFPRQREVQIREWNKSQLIYLFFISGYGHLLSCLSQASSEHGCEFVYERQNWFF